MKEKINEHDMTKRMMAILRGGYKKYLITEENTNNQEDILSSQKDNNQKDTLSPQKGDSVYEEELKKLMDIVDSSAQISNFKIYPIDRNVIIEGKLLEGEDKNSGIIFEMNLKKRELTTTMEGIDLTDNVSLILQKLKGYYQNWCDEWSRKIATEYNQKM